jgi:hypothetical protein
VAPHEVGGLTDGVCTQTPQGTHMYTLYSKYGATNAAVTPGSLFAIGFTSSGRPLPALQSLHPKP